MSVLRDPKLHFTRATELASRSRFLHVRAKEVAIVNPSAAAIIEDLSLLDRSAAVYHIAQALEAKALLEQIKSQGCGPIQNLSE